MLKIFLHNYQGEALGEIATATNRRLSTGLNRVPTFSFDIPLKGNNLTDEIIEAADAVLTSPLPTDYRWVSVYRDDFANPGSPVLIFMGLVILCRDGAAENNPATLSITATGPGWILTKRLANNENNDGRREQGLSIYGERGLIAKELIDTTNALDGNSFIRALSGDQDTTDEISITNWGGFQTVAKAIEDLSGGASVSGFDYMIEPANTSDSQGKIFGYFKSAPLLGTDKATGENAVVFEYGIGRANLREAFRTRSLEYWGTRFTHLSPGSDPYAITAEDNDSVSQFGYFEEILDGDLIDQTLRQEWLNINRTVRSRPRRLYEITPERSDIQGVGAYQPLIDYSPGDLVQSRAYYGDRLRWDNALRIYTLDISWGDDNEEQAELGLVME